jgi:hypothetical protein
MDTRTATIKVYKTYVHPVYGQLYEYASHRAGILCARTFEQVKVLVSSEQAHYANGKFFVQSPDGQMSPVQMIVNVEYH